MSQSSTTKDAHLNHLDKSVSHLPFRKADSENMISPTKSYVQGQKILLSQFSLRIIRQYKEVIHDVYPNILQSLEI